MSPAVWGGLVGATGGLGLVLVLSRAVTVRRADLAVRVLPYVRDVPSARRSGVAPLSVSSISDPSSSRLGPLTVPEA